MTNQRHINILLLLLVSAGILLSQKTRHVVIVVIDGARYSETFGDSTHALIPYMWNELRQQGVVYTKYYNDGKTQTNPGHSSVLSGTWQYIANDGSEYSHSPSIFEYLRKQKSLPATDCWVALGKDKLDVLARSTHPDYGAAYGASVRTSLDPASDPATMDNVKYVLQNNRSKITIANLASTDIDGHAGDWVKYTASIKRADSLIAVLWQFIQNDVELKNKTTLIVTNDHGRHTTDFVNHGDGCDGCRHIMLMVLGPDTPKGILDSTLSSQIDIAPTVGKMMRFSTPLAAGKVIETAIAYAMNVSVSMNNPPVSTISGNYPLQWSIGAVKESVSTLIEYSRDDGNTWKELTHIATRDSQFSWNTTEVPDGTRYRLRIEVLGDTTYGFAQTLQSFTINNPGNSAPDAQLLSPNRNIIVSGIQQVTWSAADPEGDPVSISLSASTDNGITWSSVVSGHVNSGTYAWNTVQFANSKSFLLKLVCSDGVLSSAANSPRFEVQNVRQKVQALLQTAGSGSGTVFVNVCEPEQLTGNTYRISFTEGMFSAKMYSVLNVTSNTPVLSNVPFPGDGSEGPLFDGLRIAVTDYEEPAHNKDSTRWTIGSSNLFSMVLLPVFVLPDGNITAVPEAADYEVRISDVIVDSSKDYFGAPVVPLFFTVYNTSFQHKTPIVISELSPDGKWSFGDDIYFFKKDSSGKDVLSWEVIVDGPEGAVEPKGGDVYRISTNKPITGEDRYEFNAVVTSVHMNAGNLRRYSISQNYPNPFNPVTRIDISIPNDGNISLRVFDLVGREVHRAVDQFISAGVHSFMISGSNLASGIYFYRLTSTTADGVRQWISPVNKMILLK